jgi:hypothetical protein
MVAIFAPDIPILEWMEEKIIVYCKKNDIDREKLWGYDSDWNDLVIDESMEAQLEVYDELIETVSRKIICQECLKEDDVLWKKYYHRKDDFDVDYEFNIDDLK